VTGQWLLRVEDIATLMNNRQNGRRRGRGGVRPPNGGNMGSSGNRIDNRSRGNASQLYEKYKTMARDAQTQGDRVMTEYYLQFADHYFRVLAETRPRFEEQQRRQRDDQYDDDEDNDLDVEAAGDERDGHVRDGQGRDSQGRDEQPRDRQPRRDRDQQPRYEGREQRYESGRYENAREERGEGEEQRIQRRDDRGDEQPQQQGNARRRGRNGYGERRGYEQANGETPRMDADRLPPSLGRPVGEEPVANGVEIGGGASDEAPVTAEAVAPAPRRTRRPRRTQPDGDAGETVAAEA